MVRPVIDSASPCSTPRASRTFITWGIPPARCRSVATNRPEGLRSHSTGTRARIVSKSSSTSGTPAARAGAGTGAPLDLEQFGGVDLAGAEFAHCLERAHDREIAAVVAARLDRPAVHEHRRDVQARDRDHRAGHVLVAPAHGEHAV